MRPLFMLTTELISIPTGFIFLVALGTFWKAKIRLTVPMLFAMAFFVNFLFGGISGVFLSDVPADTTAHGSFFVMAHFHYTIMGGLIFAFFGGIYYWLPKVMGITLNQRLGKIHFWTMFITFNSTFMPLFAVGMLGQPRRVFEYARNLETLNDWVSISAFCLGVSMLIFIFNFVMSTVVWRKRAPQNPWQARGLEWQIPSPPPPDNFAHIPVVLAGPYEYGDPDALPVADLNPPAGVIAGALARRPGQAPRRAPDRRRNACQKSPRRAAARPRPGRPRRTPSTTRRRSTRRGRAAGWRSAGCRSCSGRSRSPTSTCSPSNGHSLWLPKSNALPQIGYGVAIMALIVVSALVQTVGLQRIKAGRKGPWVDVGARRPGPRPGRGGAADRAAARPAVPARPVRFRQRLRRVLPGGARHLASRHDLAGDPRRSRTATSRRSHSWSSRLPTRETFEVQRFQSSLSAFTLVWNYLAIVAFIFWLFFYVR